MSGPYSSYSDDVTRLIQVLSDTFTGAYAADYVRQISSPSVDWDIQSAVVRANKAAAISIGRMGAQGHIS